MTVTPPQYTLYGYWTNGSLTTFITTIRKLLAVPSIVSEFSSGAMEEWVEVYSQKRFPPPLLLFELCRYLGTLCTPTPSYFDSKCRELGLITESAVYHKPHTLPVSCLSDLMHALHLEVAEEADRNTINGTLGMLEPVASDQSFAAFNKRSDAVDKENKGRYMLHLAQALDKVSAVIDTDGANSTDKVITTLTWDIGPLLSNEKYPMTVHSLFIAEAVRMLLRSRRLSLEDRLHSTIKWYP